MLCYCIEQVSVCKSSTLGSCNYTSIAVAITSAQAYDTIVVAAGEYTDDPMVQVTVPLTITYT
jgi:hypothetical protein